MEFAASSELNAPLEPKKLNCEGEEGAGTCAGLALSKLCAGLFDEIEQVVVFVKHRSGERDAALVPARAQARRTSRSAAPALFSRGHPRAILQGREKAHPVNGAAFLFLKRRRNAPYCCGSRRDQSTLARSLARHFLNRGEHVLEDGAPADMYFRAQCHARDAAAAGHRLARDRHRDG